MQAWCVLWGSLHQVGLLWWCGATTRPRGLLIPEPGVVQGQGEALALPVCAWGSWGWMEPGEFPLSQLWCFLLPCSHWPLSDCPKRTLCTGWSQWTNQSPFSGRGKHLLPRGAFRKEVEAKCCSFSRVTLAGAAAVPAVTRAVDHQDCSLATNECTKYQDPLGICWEPFGQTLPCRKS